MCPGLLVISDITLCLVALHTPLHDTHVTDRIPSTLLYTLRDSPMALYLRLDVLVNQSCYHVLSQSNISLSRVIMYSHSPVLSQTRCAPFHVIVPYLFIIIRFA